MSTDERMGLRVAVQMDPLEPINIEGDSTFALMLEAQSRGHQLWHYEVRHLALREGRMAGGAAAQRLTAMAQFVKLRRLPGSHFTAESAELVNLASMDVVLMRQDPPFDMAYITATHMLEHIAATTLVVNNPASVRNAPEKLLVTHFPELMPPTLITWDAQAIRDFRSEHSDIIVKPLFGNGGAGVFRIKPDDENLASLLEMHFARSREPLMIQRYEPAVAQGEARSNMHVGGRAEACRMTARDLEICRRIGPLLKAQGLIFVGIDVIGDWLTEINVTSPTGLQEIARFDGTNLAGLIWDAIEARRSGLNG